MHDLAPGSGALFGVHNHEGLGFFSWQGGQDHSGGDLDVPEISFPGL